MHSEETPPRHAERYAVPFTSRGAAAASHSYTAAVERECRHGLATPPRRRADTAPRRTRRTAPRRRRST
ncbi:hypothetical protein AB1Y20_013458 [Prymnesium parvum]|uniref:Uncharacterized protein n=1 Tax=Prymnesium parvum TaxID=97485 RepID=A0AB34IHK0_PRYPA